MVTNADVCGGEMSKPEWEKTRDAFDYINGLNGQGSVGVYGALGAEARRAQQSTANPVRPKRSKTRHTAPPQASSTANAFEPETTFGAIFMWACIIVGVCGGVWVAFSHPDYSGVPVWQRLGGGVLGGFFAVSVALWLLNWAIQVLLPFLFRLAAMAAVFGGIVWLIMLSEGKL